MIEKICEELAVLHVKSEFRPVFEREVRQKALMEAINIVREVAKEYGKEVKNCATCANYTDFDEIDNGCYMCCKGLENNYVPKSAPYQKGE